MVSDNAVILAGGRSSRFGSDKAFASFQGEPLIERIISQLYTNFSRVIVVAGDPENFRTLNAEITTDSFRNRGPLGGIHAGLMKAQGDYAFVTACDMPYISSELIGFMRSRMEMETPDAFVVRRNGMIEPFSGFYGIHMIRDMETYFKEGKTTPYRFLKGKKLSIIEYSDFFCENSDPEYDIFSNINSRKDLEELSIREDDRKKG